MIRVRSCKACLVVIVMLSFSSVIEILISHKVDAFHLSLGKSLIMGATNPQLTPASKLIRPVECRNSNNHSEVGICMFSIDCMQNKGVPLSICKHNYFVGTCCRLPDYNNFVGIVYDLRETETSQQLEARKVARETASSVTFSPQTSSTWPEPGPQLLDLVGSIAKTVSSRLPQETIQQITTTQRAPNFASSSSERPEDKYMISSTSLFPTTLKPSQELVQEIVQVSAQPQPERLVALKVGESARNADGGASDPAAFSPGASSSSSLAGKLQILVPGETDSFQIQTVATNQSRSSESSHRVEELPIPNVDSKESKVAIGQQIKQQLDSYELIRDDSLEVLSTMTSAHQPPTTQQQFELPDQGDQRRAGSAQPETPIGQQNSIYLVDESAQRSEAQHTIVFANNHQQQASTTNRPIQIDVSTPSTIIWIQNQSSQPASDQEFTLSTATTSSDHNLNKSGQDLELSSTSAHVHPEVENKSTIKSNATDEATTSTTSQHPTLPITVSPFVDLVSSNSAQTTTPFTTSLSTALLPNISSHPYAPTTQAPQLVALSSLVPIQNLSSTTRLSQIQPTQRPTSEPPSLQGFSQFYSNPHHEGHQSQPATYQHSSRPHLGSPPLQAATKIVTGGSSANNLIPGLSNLQSAILSHIPFKLASGLSSGLSSYLQAAMKPTGSRPLISSNTAPSLQFQQQQLLQTNSTAKPASSNSASVIPTSQSQLPSLIKFPGSTAPPSETASQIDKTNSTSQNSSSLDLHGGGGSVVQNGTSEPSLPHDVVWEALQVCGRPQVGQLSGPGEGKRRVARIVGGNQSLFGQWPWMVSLRQWRKGAFLHKCGAALLNENWAITAAHCVENVKASDLLLRLGEFDVSNQEEPYPYIERRVKTVVSHPSFDPKTFEYDLALLRFAEPIKYERNIIPVCVPTGNDSYVDRMATVIGWGRLYEDGPLPDVIQHVDVPIITNNECEKMYKNAGYVEEIPEMFICAGISKGGRDSCEGDSGGPLTMVDHDGRSYLVGIISWGIGCALPSQPGVYTRITAFKGWINQITAF